MEGPCWRRGTQRRGGKENKMKDLLLSFRHFLQESLPPVQPMGTAPAPKELTREMSDQGRTGELPEGSGWTT